MTMLPAESMAHPANSLDSFSDPEAGRELAVYFMHLIIYLLVFVVIIMTRKHAAPLLYELGLDMHHFLRPRAGVSLPGPMPGGFGDEEAEAARDHAGAFGERVPQGGLVPGIVLSVAGIVLAVLSLPAIGVHSIHDWSEDMPLGFHWALTVATLVILHSLVLMRTISLLAYHPHSDHSHRQHLALFRSTLEYSFVIVLLPLVSHAVSRSPFTDLYPYAGGRRTVLIAVVGQPIVGFLLGLWAGVGRWWMGDCGEEGEEEA